MGPMWKELLYANFAFLASSRMNPIIAEIRRLSGTGLTLTSPLTMMVTAEESCVSGPSRLQFPAGSLSAYR